MHELSICEAIFNTVQKYANEKEVAKVHLTIGQYRQIVPDTLIFCWEAQTRSTSMQGSELVVDYVQVIIRCRKCGQETNIVDPVIQCASCGSSDVDVLSGDEFVVDFIDVKDA